MPDSIPIGEESILVNLSIDKVALCKQGINSQAHILLAKAERKENKDMPKTFEEVLTSLEPGHAELINKHIADLEQGKDGVIAELTGEVAALKDTIEKAKEVPSKEETVNPEEEIIKSASPELAEYIRGLQNSVNTLIEDRAETVAKSRFEEVKALPVEEETLKTVLKSASPATFEVLKAAAQAVRETVLTPVGKDVPSDSFSSNADAAYAKLEKSAHAIMAEDANLTFEQAFDRACTKDPAIYTEYCERGMK